MKARLLLIISIIYMLTIICFSLYWAINFTRYVHYKGDEFFVFAEIILGMTYIFYLVIQLTVKRINFLFALSIPLLTCIAAFFIGIFMLFLRLPIGIPRQYIMVYGILYCALTLFATFKYWGKTLIKK